MSVYYHAYSHFTRWF